jgi:hypothetical protein
MNTATCFRNDITSDISLENIIRFREEIISEMNEMKEEDRRYNENIQDIQKEEK